MAPCPSPPLDPPLDKSDFIWETTRVGYNLGYAHFVYADFYQLPPLPLLTTCDETVLEVAATFQQKLYTRPVFFAEYRGDSRDIVGAKWF